MRVPTNLVFNKETDEFVRGSSENVPKFDPATEVLVISQAGVWPPETGERYDGAAGLRPATTAELAARAAVVEEEAITQALADLSVNPVVLRMLMDIEKRLRSLGAEPSSFVPLRDADTLAELRREIARKYARNAPRAL